MRKYMVYFKLDCLYTVCVKAENSEDALDKAKDIKFEDMNYSPRGHFVDNISEEEQFLRIEDIGE